MPSILPAGQGTEGKKLVMALIKILGAKKKGENPDAGFWLKKKKKKKKTTSHYEMSRQM